MWREHEGYFFVTNDREYGDLKYGALSLPLHVPACPLFPLHRCVVLVPEQRKGRLLCRSGKLFPV